MDCRPVSAAQRRQYLLTFGTLREERKLSTARQRERLAKLAVRLLSSIVQTVSTCVRIGVSFVAPRRASCCCVELRHCVAQQGCWCLFRQSLVSCCCPDAPRLLLLSLAHFSAAGEHPLCVCAVLFQASFDRALSLHNNRVSFSPSPHNSISRSSRVVGVIHHNCLEAVACTIALLLALTWLNHASNDRSSSDISRTVTSSSCARRSEGGA